MPINSPDVFDSITNAEIVSGTGGGGTSEIQIQDSFGATINAVSTLQFLRKEFKVSAGAGANEGKVILTGYQDIDTGSITLGENGDANIVSFYNWNSFVGGTTGSIYTFYHPGSNQFQIADNRFLAQTKNFLCMKAFTASSLRVILEGVCKVDTSNWTLSNLYTGSPVYLDSNGLTTDTVPTTAGEFVRVVWYIIDYARGIIYFKPDDTVIERK